ncbi:hypothetical protein JCM8097_000121 [Rhodosporidiobolus ruineniae]
MPVSLAPPALDYPDALFLGLDLSTQALKAIILDTSLRTVGEFGVRFDEDLPRYKTTSGVHLGEGGEVTSPVMMWVEALDLLLERITQTEHGRGLLQRVKAQHASVYWSSMAAPALSALDPTRPLSAQLSPSAFALPTSPNWQDSSTSTECRDLEAAVGGPEALTQRTGSRAHERFTGPQILKLRRARPDVYEQTERISLVSSFLTTLLCADGEIKALEESDACGMNLWNLETGQGWDPDLLRCVAGGEEAVEELARKLGPVEKDGGRVAGKIGRWFVERYGMSEDCLVNHCTGDNNATILSFSLLPGEVVVSLGTSDTILLSTTEYAPDPDLHVFSYPTNRAGGKRSYMAMLCYKNGSLPREYVRDRYAGGQWEVFDKLVVDAGYPVTADEAAHRPIGFYFLKKEIIPRNAHGIFHFEGNNLTAVEEFSDPSFNARAVLESQFLSFRQRTTNMLSSTTGLPLRIYAVGGASANQCIKNTLATVLAAPVYQPAMSSANSCAVGGAMKAYWAYARTTQPELTFEAAVKLARRRHASSADPELVAAPMYEATVAYDAMMGRFAELEKQTYKE